MGSRVCVDPGLRCGGLDGAHPHILIPKREVSTPSSVYCGEKYTQPSVGERSAVSGLCRRGQGWARQEGSRGDKVVLPLSTLRLGREMDIEQVVLKQD